MRISAASRARLRQARLLVFDLDGTLIDSREDLAYAVNATLRHFGKPELSLATIASYVGDGAFALVQRAFQVVGLDANDPQILKAGHQQFLHFYGKHKLDHTYVYPGALDALRTIRSRSPGVVMACLTNKPVMASRAICEALGLAPFFFQIYGGNSFPTKKPDPLGLSRLIAEAAGLVPDNLNITPDNTIMVGDGRPDILAARAAGAQAIGCDFGFSEVDLASLQPDALVTSPRDWVALLCGA